jgi:hypothetical protein
VRFDHGGATHLAVTARSMKLVPHWDAAKHRQVYGIWDFADGGFDRTALIAVSAAGDLAFVRWTGEAVTPPPDPGPMLDCEAPAARSPATSAIPSTRIRNCG